MTLEKNRSKGDPEGVASSAMTRCPETMTLSNEDDMKNNLTVALGALIATGLLLGPGAALAQSVGDIATDLRSQVTNVNLLVTVISFVLGVALAIVGIMKFKAHSQNPNDPSAKMSTAFILMFAGAALVAIPAVLGSGIQTIWGSGAATTDATGGFNSL